MNKLGFGFLRLPRLGGDDSEFDFALLERMVDRFLEAGGNYFDTAYTYLGGKSETALREVLVKRHSRSSFRVADKLPSWLVKSHEDCQRYFDEQLERCGVEKFDVYMLHWLNRKNYAICEEHGEFAFLREVKARGRADKIGFSYHDGPELLNEILSAHPCVDQVQLQINYLDWENSVLRARECYEVAVRHGKPVVVMEPVKGGSLASLAPSASEVLRAMDTDASEASWAIRFAQSLSSVSIVLSGMNTMEQLNDNLRDTAPLTEREIQTLLSVAEQMRGTIAVPCTGCRYCVDHCPRHIPIPQMLALYNDYARSPGEGWKMQYFYDDLKERFAKASDCIACRACERHCPQKIEISAHLKPIANAFER